MPCWCVVVAVLHVGGDVLVIFAKMGRQAEQSADTSPRKTILKLENKASSILAVYPQSHNHSSCADPDDS
jgi:hypothetical protein